MGEDRSGLPSGRIKRRAERRARRGGAAQGGLGRRGKRAALIRTRARSNLPLRKPHRIAEGGTGERRRPQGRRARLQAVAMDGEVVAGRAVLPDVGLVHRQGLALEGFIELAAPSVVDAGNVGVVVNFRGRGERALAALEGQEAAFAGIDLPRAVGRPAFGRIAPFDKQADLARGGLSGFPCVGGRLDITPPWPLMKRSPNRTANWALACDHSRGGIFHSFSDRFKIR